MLEKRPRGTATYLYSRREISNDLKRAIHNVAQRNGSMTSVPVMHLSTCTTRTSSRGVLISSRRGTSWCPSSKSSGIASVPLMQ